MWALELAVAASRTTNPLLLALLLAAAGLVVAARRGDAPWALAFRMYLLLAAVIVAMRVGFRILVGGGAGDHILIILPELPLPEAAAGIRLLGPVTAEQILSGFYDGLRLATMLVCVGAANALANPKRLLKAMPGALSEIRVRRWWWRCRPRRSWSTARCGSGGRGGCGVAGTGDCGRSTASPYPCW